MNIINLYNYLLSFNINIHQKKYNYIIANFINNINLLHII